MARTVRPDEHALRRDEILDAAQRLVRTKGYQAMTIQDVLDELRSSKGALYHYFGSKPALLEALVGRMHDRLAADLAPVLADTAASAPERLRRFLDTLAGRRNDEQAFFVGVMRVWYSDGNALLRQKVRADALRRFGPMLAEVIEQGVREGTMATTHPAHMGEVALGLSLSHADTLARSLLDGPAGTGPAADERELARMAATTAAYSEAVERVLGMAPGSVRLTDTETLRAWLAAVAAQREEAHHA
ncbi:TetR/AcrR family transcriptional regulator [Allonocardiopsis opalescens]|uniref:TetR family transcriptional regulator n=1 Tax=Allonocardiopsis opalescens TaxID=1144618 RepID=A0A2T0PXF2_9ACTN|nr:TetR/AcrR family transcriptional regulator [Allonocardiopsis opalescens]PRX96217.1 TetR family transcriptional regulator [Allonocardiopsis opalescens]